MVTHTVLPWFTMLPTLMVHHIHIHSMIAFDTFTTAAIIGFELLWTGCNNSGRPSINTWYEGINVM